MTRKAVLDITRTACSIAGPEYKYRGLGCLYRTTIPQSCGDRAQAEDCHGSRVMQGLGPNLPNGASKKGTSAPVTSRKYTLDTERHNLCLLACRAEH